MKILTIFNSDSGNTPKISQNITKEEVLKYFLKLEATKNSFYSKELYKISQLSGNNLLFKVREYAASRKDTNPALIWLGGYNHDRRDKTISHWIYTSISIDLIYTCGINDQINSFLCKDKIQWNIMKLCKQLFSIGRKGLNKRYSIDISAGNRIILGIAHRTEGKLGQIELIDGFHRLIALINDGATIVDAYIGIAN